MHAETNASNYLMNTDNVKRCSTLNIL